MNNESLRSFAKWLLTTFALVILSYGLWSADAPDVVMFQFLFLPWIVGPAAIPALLALRTKSASRRWAYVIAEVLVVGSTALLWIMAFLQPDTQNGIALIFFPVLQYAGVLVWCICVFLAGRIGTGLSNQP